MPCPKDSLPGVKTIFAIPAVSQSLRDVAFLVYHACGVQKVFSRHAISWCAALAVSDQGGRMCTQDKQSELVNDLTSQVPKGPAPQDAEAAGRSPYESVLQVHDGMRVTCSHHKFILEILLMSTQSNARTILVLWLGICMHVPLWLCVCVSVCLRLCVCVRMQRGKVQVHVYTLVHA